METPTQPSNHSSSGSSNSSNDEDFELLLYLPTDIFVGQVIRFLSRKDKQCLREANRHCRRLVNAAVKSCLLDAASLTALPALQHVPCSFPCLQHISIVSGSSSISDGGSSRTSDGILVSKQLEQQLPEMLTKLPMLSSFCYEGPTDRRLPGLDITPALAAAAAAAAATTTAAAAGSGTVLEATSEPPATGTAAAAAAAAAAMTGRDSCSDSSVQLQQQQQQQHPQQQQQHLTRLELQSGRLPDSLMDVVGQLRSLRSLKLTATTAVTTAPVAQLSLLTHLDLTVTPPLGAALAPLGKLRNLAVLRLAAISPARGWGAALQHLQGCALVELQLVFADICDADLAAVVALQGLTHLDLHCSRHLTGASVVHFAQLPQLCVLHLAHTGLQLGGAELLLLGAGCPQLTQLHAGLRLRAVDVEFDLRGIPDMGQQSSSSSRPPAQQHTQHSSGSSRRQGAGATHELIVPNSDADSFDGTISSSSSVLHRMTCGSTTRVESNNTNAGMCSSKHPLPPSWPCLKHLSITSGCSVSNLSKILHHCPDLQQLGLEGLGPNGNEIAAELASRATQLRSLTITGCSGMSEAACAAVARSLRSLRELTLIEVALPASHLLHLLLGTIRPLHSSHVTSTSCDIRDSSSRQLTKLHVERCCGMTTEVISHGVAALRNLIELELIACDRIVGDQELLQVAVQLPRLKTMRVSGCGLVPDGFERRFEITAAARSVLLAV